MDKQTELLNYMLTERAKEFCDSMKLQILDKLIEIAYSKSEGHYYVTAPELEFIKKGLDKLRSKEHDEKMKSLASVLISLASRGDEELTEVS